MTTTDTTESDTDHGPVFVFDVDGTTYETDRPRVTGAELFDITDTDLSVGLVLINEDGTTTTVKVDDEYLLTPKANFKRRPHFRRG